MFEKKNRISENDPLQEKFDGIDELVCAPDRLVKAAKSGLPWGAGNAKYTAGTHVRKFTKAAVAYAAGIALLLGAILLLPRLFGEHPPVATQPSETTQTTTTTPPHKDAPSEELPSPGKLFQLILSESNVTFAYKNTYLFTDGRTLDTTILLMRDGNRIYQKNELVDTAGEADYLQECYYDTDASVMYSCTDGVWSKDESKSASWEDVCDDPVMYEFFEDAYYELVDGVYTVTEKGLDRYFMGDDIAKDYYGRMVWDYTMQGDVYTIRRIISEADGRVSTRIGLEISFGKASVTLPDAEECEHRYNEGYCVVCGRACEHDFLSSENVPTCTEGCTVEHSCIKCGYSYDEWLDALGHVVSGGVCIRCGEKEGQLGTEDCEHQYSEVFPNGICIVCGEECRHDYPEEDCGASCPLCGKKLGHDYETSTSTEQICTEGTLTTTTCSRCGYGYTENTPAKGHSYNSNDICTVCGEAKKVISITDPNVTAGSVSLLPGQMYLTYPDLSADGFYWMDPTSTPCFYNVYTYFAGYTITDIRVPVYLAEKGSVLTIGVSRTENGINTDRVAFYKLTADRDIDREWVLFSGLSINVPEGCTLTFGWMDDTMVLMHPSSGHIPGYSYCNDYAGSCGETPLIMDIYGKKN